MNKTDEVKQARVREAIEESMPEDPDQRRAFVEWITWRLYQAAPDKAAFLVHLDDCIDRALRFEAGERGLQ
jgi:hypothetical protein